MPDRESGEPIHAESLLLCAGCGCCLLLEIRNSGECRRPDEAREVRSIQGDVERGRVGWQIPGGSICEGGEAMPVLPI